MSEKNEPQLDVTVDEYRVVFTVNGGLVAYRYGRRWRELHGDNLVFSLAAKVDKLSKELASKEEVFNLVQEERFIQLAEGTERGQIMEYLRRYRAEVGETVPIVGAVLDDLMQYIESRGEIIELSLSEAKDMAARYESALKYITTLSEFSGKQMHAAAIEALKDRVEQKNYPVGIGWDREEKTAGGMTTTSIEDDTEGYSTS